MFRKHRKEGIPSWDKVQNALKELCEDIFDIEDLLSRRIIKTDRTAKAVICAADRSRKLMALLDLGEPAPAPEWKVKKGGFEFEDLGVIVATWGTVNEEAFDIWNPVLQWLTIGDPRYRCFCAWGNSIVRATCAIQNEKRLAYPIVGKQGGRFS
jgi:hypothetical protein